jgi:fumarate hydratase class I
MNPRKDKFTEIFAELIRRASSDLPRDVESALREALEREEGTSREVISVMLRNILLARKESGPLCQDTGLQTWTVRYPFMWDAELLRSRIAEATARATRQGYLRPNAVSPVTSANSGDNTGLHHPIIELEPWKKGFMTADILLKGGGSENVSSQLSLPDASIGAGRDLDGVRRAVLKMIHAAQGKGCSLGIGPMGFGGRTTVLGVKIAAAARHPASFFVTMAYGCWALRRWSLKAGKDGAKPSYSQKPFK